MKNALVTGASTGIGQQTSIEMSKAGYHIFLIARSKNKLEETSKLISQNGGKSTIIQTDLSDLNSINNLINKIKNNANHLDSIINIAGIWHGKNKVFANIDYQNFDQKEIIDTYMVGFTAPALIVHGLLPIMPSGSKIVNLSGTFENGGKGWIPYYASKRGLEDFTIGLSQELKNKNILVNAVSPSDTATEQYSKYFPEYMKEAIDPNKIALKIVELCNDKNLETGKVIVMKKGKTPFEGFHH